MKKFLLLTLLNAFIISASVAQQIPFQGRLLENGAEVNGTKDFTFTIDVDGNVWTETHSTVPVSNGLYSIVLGSISPLPDNLFGNVDSRTLEISISGVTLSSVAIYAPFVNSETIKQNMPASIDATFNDAASEHSTLDVTVDGTGAGSNAAIKAVANTEGNNRAIKGFALNPTGTGNNMGVMGQAESLGKYNHGVYGHADGTGNGDEGHGFGEGSINFGIEGNATGNAWNNTGVEGSNYGAVGQFNYGVSGLSNAGDMNSENTGVRGNAFGTGVNRGVFGWAGGGTENWAGWFDGDVMITGNLISSGAIPLQVLNGSGDLRAEMGLFNDGGSIKAYGSGGLNAAILGTRASNDAQGFLGLYNTAGVAGINMKVEGGPGTEYGSILTMGPNTPNVQIIGKNWQDTDLPTMQMFGLHTNGGGGNKTNVLLEVDSDGTNNWGKLTLENGIEGASPQEPTVKLDGFDGSLTLRSADGSQEVRLDPSGISGGTGSTTWDITGKAENFGSQTTLIGSVDPSNIEWYQNALSGRGATTDGNNVGVYGVSDENSDKWQIGVYGVSGGDGIGLSYGVRGEVFGSSSPWSYGVIGYNQITPPDNAKVIGVVGKTFKGAPGSMNYAVWGKAQGNAGKNIGIFAEAINGDENWAGWFEGDVHITGNLTVNGAAPGGGGGSLGDLILSDPGILGGQNFANFWISNDPGGSDPGGYSGTLGLEGTSTPNFQLHGRQWENNNLPIFEMFGSTGDGGGWYHANLNLSVNSDGTDEWGSLDLNKTNIVGETLETTISFDGMSGGASFVGGLVSVNADGDDSPGDGEFNIGSSSASGIRMYGKLDDVGGSRSHIALDGESGEYVNLWGTGDIDLSGSLNASGDINAGGANLSGNISISNPTGNITLWDGGDGVRMERIFDGVNPQGGYVSIAGTGSITLDGTNGDINNSGNINTSGNISSNDINTNSLNVTGGVMSGDPFNNGVHINDGAPVVSIWSGASETILLNGDNSSIDLTSGTGNVALDGQNGNIGVSGDVSSLSMTTTNLASQFIDASTQVQAGDFFGGTGTLMSAGGNIDATGTITSGDINASGNVQSGDIGGGTGVMLFNYGDIDLSQNLNAGGDVNGVNFVASGNINGVDVNLSGGIGAGGDINTSTNISAVNISASGVLSSGDGTVQTSDRRFKKNIETIRGALDNTLKLRGVSYNWKDSKKSQKNQIGVIAQEVEEVYPEFVHTMDEGYKAVNYAQMTAVLIEAIKELNAKVESLVSENSDLKAELTKVNTLEEKINRLEKLLTGEPDVAEFSTKVSGN